MWEELFAQRVSDFMTRETWLGVGFSAPEFMANSFREQKLSLGETDFLARFCNQLVLEWVGFSIVQKGGAR